MLLFPALHSVMRRALLRRVAFPAGYGPMRGRAAYARKRVGIQRNFLGSGPARNGRGRLPQDIIADKGGKCKGQFGGMGVAAAGASEASPQGRRGMGGLLGNNLQSPSAGQAFYKVIICMPDGGGGFVITSGGASLIKDFSWHACPAGAYFCTYKSRQNTLGALPQDPCRWLCWIRISFSLNDREKQIRTAHRIAPKVAAAHLPFPPTPFPDGGKGARMGGQVQGGSLVLGVC